MRDTITASCVYGVSKKEEQDYESSHESSAWTVTLRCQRRRMTVPFFQGLAYTGEPRAEVVISCLLSDASSADEHSTFEGWCRDLGMDADSIKARRMYDACAKTWERMKKFLGETRFAEALSANDPEAWAKAACTETVHDNISDSVKSRQRKKKRR